MNLGSCGLGFPPLIRTLSRTRSTVRLQTGAGTPRHQASLAPAGGLSQAGVPHRYTPQSGSLTVRTRQGVARPGPALGALPASKAKRPAPRDSGPGGQISQISQQPRRPKLLRQGAQVLPLWGMETATVASGTALTRLQGCEGQDDGVPERCSSLAVLPTPGRLSPARAQATLGHHSVEVADATPGTRRPGEAR